MGYDILERGYRYDTKTRYSETWTQQELNDLIRKLGLPEDGFERLSHCEEYLAVRQRHK